MRRWIAMGVLCVLSGCGAESNPGSQQAQTQPAEAAPARIEVTRIVEGTGLSPAKTDTVVVHYHGTFPDGRVFDSSRDRGEPARFPLNRVIRCWTDAVSQMKVGGKAQLVCPPEAAYGSRGAPPAIPPDATLHFEVELLGIE